MTSRYKEKGPLIFCRTWDHVGRAMNIHEPRGRCGGGLKGYPLFYKILNFYQYF